MNQDKNEVKKLFYKQQPRATFLFIRKGEAYYKSTLEYENKSETYSFRIPINDMGEADYFSEMDAKFLLRWLV